MPSRERAATRFRPRSWSIAVCAMVLVCAAALWSNYGTVPGALGIVAAGGWLFFGSLPRPDRHNVRFVSVLAAIGALVVTWSTAMFLGVVYVNLFVENGVAADWIPIALLAATNVGGLIAVFRSAQTRTETGAALREIGGLRIAVLSAPVIEAAERARVAKTVDELTASLGSMLQLAVGLSLLPRAVDQASLWALDEAAGEWFICAATTPPPEQQFRQKQLATERAGAGIVANLAANAPLPEWPNTVRERDVYLVGARLHEHPWYIVNPAKDRPADGMAAVLLRRDDAPVGALCFTWEARVIPTEGSQAEEMIDILERWAQAFHVGLDRLYQLREELA